LCVFCYSYQRAEIKKSNKIIAVKHFQAAGIKYIQIIIWIAGLLSAFLMATSETKELSTVTKGRKYQLQHSPQVYTPLLHFVYYNFKRSLDVIYSGKNVKKEQLIIPF